MGITKKDRITTGAVDYFPNALAAVGRWSMYNNTKYPPAKPSDDGSPRWSFDVSTEHADAISSHLAQRGTLDEETGFSHSVPLVWRALALLETELVRQGAKPGLAVLRHVLHDAYEVDFEGTDEDLAALGLERVK